MKRKLLERCVANGACTLQPCTPARSVSEPTNNNVALKIQNLKSVCRYGSLSGIALQLFANTWTCCMVKQHHQQRMLTWACTCGTHAGVTFLKSKVDKVNHAEGASSVALDGDAVLQGSLVLDATGHSRRLVEFDKKFDPGYQGAYGIICGEKLLCSHS